MGRYESGGRISRGLIYHPDRFPEGLIGEAEILWRSSESETVSRRTLWLRLHPSIFQETWEALELDIKSRLAAIAQAGSSTSSRMVNLQIRDLRGEVDGFEITGPMAGQVLRRVLRLCKSEASEKHMVKHIHPRWIVAHAGQFFEALGSAQSSAEFPDGLVAGVKAYDPRLQYVPTRPRSVLR
jgi:ribonuclease P/MRP protein subunit POP1